MWIPPDNYVFQKLNLEKEISVELLEDKTKILEKHSNSCL